MSDYGAYEGTKNPQEYERSHYQQQAQVYSQPPQQPQSQLDDNMVEAISQRIIQRTQQQNANRLDRIGNSENPKNIMGMRLALAIVSIALLVPISAISLGLLGPWGIGPFIFAVIGMIAINGIFAGGRR